MGQMGQEIRTGEIKNDLKFSVGKPKRKRHIVRPRARCDVKDNVLTRT